MELLISLLVIGFLGSPILVVIALVAVGNRKREIQQLETFFDKANERLLVLERCLLQKTPTGERSGTDTADNSEQIRKLGTLLTEVDSRLCKLESAFKEALKDEATLPKPIDSAPAAAIDSQLSALSRYEMARYTMNVAHDEAAKTEVRSEESPSKEAGLTEGAVATAAKTPALQGEEGARIEAVTAFPDTKAVHVEPADTKTAAVASTEKRDDASIERGAIPPDRPMRPVRPMPTTVQTSPATATREAAAQQAASSPVVRERTAHLPSHSAPPQPDFLTQWFNKAFEWAIGGNLLVRIGLLLLFFGVAFLFKLAIDHNVFPLELRLAAVAAGAIVLLILGWRLRDSRRLYALLLQGGGIGILYMTLYTGFATFKVLESAVMTSSMLIAVCVLSAFLAVRQNSPALICMGAVGAFLAPVLISTGSNNYIGLFSYYALLNAGILGIAWFKAWRPLNLLGFFFTFAVGTLWGVKWYQPADFAWTEFFLILFFLFYVAIGLLYAVRREVEIKSYIDGTLIFGAPVAFSTLQAVLIKTIPFEFGMAWSSLALGMLYLAIGFWLASFRRERLQLLFEAMLALAILFTTLAVPLAFEGRLTSAIWAVEGAALVWVALRQQRLLALVSGCCLYIFSMLFFSADVQAVHGTTPVLNSWYIGILMLAGSGAYIGWLLQRQAPQHWDREMLAGLSVLSGLFGLLWWTGGGIIEIQHYLTGVADRFYAFLLFAVLTAWVTHSIHRRFIWPGAGNVALLLPIVLFTFMLANLGAWIALDNRGLGTWSLSLAVAYFLLLRQQQEGKEEYLLELLHAILFWTAALLFSREIYDVTCRMIPEGVWRWSSWGLSGALVLAFLTEVGATRINWPVKRFPRAYLGLGAGPFILALCLWIFWGFGSTGNAAPLPYIPLLNPLELSQLLALVAIGLWIRRVTALGDISKLSANVPFVCLVFALVFVCLNTALLRASHAYFDTRYHMMAVVDSLGMQQAFVVLWLAFVAAGLLWLRNERQRLFAQMALPLMLILFIWGLMVHLSPQSAAWGRIPLLNPLDLVLLAILAGWGFYLKSVGKYRNEISIAGQQTLIMSSAYIMVFIWANAMLLRALHHWLEIPYHVSVVIDSLNYQQMFVVLWLAFVTAGLLWLRDERQRLFARMALPLMLILFIWGLMVHLSPQSAAWGRIPLLNPLDLVLLAILAGWGFYEWIVQKIDEDGSNTFLLEKAVAAALFGFVWMNAMLLRAFHHWLDIPYTFSKLWASGIVHSSMSILWTITALALMIIAVRRAWRLLWFTGFGLLGATVVKLFLVELSGIGSVARVFSFIGVGLLLLLIGYVAPLPPSGDQEKVKA